MNRRIKIIAVFSLLLTVLLPQAITAQSIQDREHTVCEQRAGRFAQLEEAFTTKTSTMNERIANARTTVDIRRQEIDEVILQTQTESNEQYKAWYSSYLEKIDSEVQTQAAGVFYEQLLELVKTRQQAVQQARIAFRTRVDEIRQDRFTAIKQQTQEFRAASESSFAQLSRDCNARQKDNTAARSKFIEDLRAARLGYGQTRRSYTSYKDQIQEAIATRKTAYQEARKNFEQGFQSALSTLRQADPNL